MATKTARPSARTETASRHAKLAALPKLGGSNEDAELHRLVYERVRLGIISALAVAGEMTFNELKELLDISDGNLSVHARKLEEGGLIQCTKTFEARRPKTEYRLTATGRKALNRYLTHMEAVIKATRG